MNSSIFEQVTSALTVKSICSPMAADIPTGTALDDLEGMSDHCLDPFNNPARVVDSDGNTIGVVWFDDYAEAGTYFQGGNEEGPKFIDDVMQRLEPNRLLSSGTTILDAVQLFTAKDSRYFYVIDINEIVGVVSYEDLFKPVGRIAFFSLALEIEDLALRLCQLPKFRESCWLSIPGKRQQMSISFFQLRFSRKPRLATEVRNRIPDIEIRNLTDVESEQLVSKFFSDPHRQSDVLRLIACTQLVDKATMIWKQTLITDRSKSDILGFFEELRKVRDNCAHPGHDDLLLAQDRLAEFVSSAMRMRKCLQEALQKSTEETV
jgi:CBS domain